MADRRTAKEVTAALYRHFTPRWAVLTEVTARGGRAPAPDPVEVLGTAFPAPATPRPGQTIPDRRIDVLMLRAGSVPGGIERLAIEIKVSRADFLSDIRNPAKQAPWRTLAHRHAYAVPEGLVAEREVPAGSGLLVVIPYSRLGDQVVWARTAKRAPGHFPDDLPRANIMDAFWRAARAEALAKGYGFGPDQKLGESELRAELLRVRRELELANNRISRESEARQKWQLAYGAVGHPPCGTCGNPLKPSRGSLSHADWTHALATDDQPCEEKRRDRAATENEQRHPDDRQPRRYLYVRPPEPADLPDLEVAS